MSQIPHDDIIYLYNLSINQSITLSVRRMEDSYCHRETGYIVTGSIQLPLNLNSGLRAGTFHSHVSQISPATGM